jgi:hypothetical protein
MEVLTQPCPSANLRNVLKQAIARDAEAADNPRW